MLKSTYKLSDYLLAIEYEYSLERLRKCRIAQQISNSSVLFKKSTKTDFVSNSWPI